MSKDTCVLLEAARERWQDRAEGRVFMHVSNEIYGSREPDELAFTEANAWYNTFDLPLIVSNCSNNYGPLQFPEKLLPLMILNAMDSKELPVYGDGQQVRDWLHVEDHCCALLLMLEHGRPGQTYVVGGGCERANIQIVRQICVEVDRLMDRPPGSSKKLLRHVVDRPGHDRRYAMNATKLRTELGWSQSTRSSGRCHRWFVGTRITEAGPMQFAPANITTTIRRSTEIAECAQYQSSSQCIEPS